jgi:hypothetical protein
MFSYKNTPSVRATKIFKNNEEYILRQFTSIFCQFMDIFGAMLAIAAHRQINVQTTAAQM